jgi:hypothetical protein
VGKKPDLYERAGGKSRNSQEIREEKGDEEIKGVEPRKLLAYACTQIPQATTATTR